MAEERSFLIFHSTRLAFLKWYLLAIILAILGFLIYFETIPTNSIIPKEYNIYVLIFLPATGIVLIILAELIRKLDTYAITNYRIIEKRGIINIKKDFIYWEKIANYSLKQSFFDRIFKVGTIELWSMGGGGEGIIEPEIVIKKAPHVKRIRKLLDKLIQNR